MEGSELVKKRLGARAYIAIKQMLETMKKMEKIPKTKIDRTLINTLSKLANKERKVEEFKRRLRIKGKIIKKGTTKKGSIKLIIQKGKDEYSFVVVKMHKEKYALAEKLNVGAYVSAAGIIKLRAIICTQLKQLQNIDESRQTKLFVS